MEPVPTRYRVPATTTGSPTVKANPMKKKKIKKKKKTKKPGNEPTKTVWNEKCGSSTGVPFGTVRRHTHTLTHSHTHTHTHTHTHAQRPGQADGKKKSETLSALKPRFSLGLPSCNGFFLT